MNRLVIWGLRQKCLVVRTAITHGQNVSRNRLMLTACGITHCIINSHLRRNSIGYLWNDSGRGGISHIKLLHLGGMGPILRVSRALQVVRVWECGGLAWGAGWTGSVGTAAEQMLGINQSHRHGASHQVTSRSVPISYELIKTYGRKNRSDHSRCQGEMHLVSGETCQVWEVHQDWYTAFFLIWGSYSIEAFSFTITSYTCLNLKNWPYHQIEVQVLNKITNNHKSL